MKVETKRYGIKTVIVSFLLCTVFVLASFGALGFGIVGRHSDIVEPTSANSMLESETRDSELAKTVWNKDYGSTKEQQDTYSQELQYPEDMKATIDYTVDTIEGGLTRGNAVASGRIFFRLGDSNRTAQAAKYTKVELWDDDPVSDNLVATTYTTSAGDYSFTFDALDDIWHLFENGRDLFLRVHTESYTLKVAGIKTMLKTYYAETGVIHSNISSGHSYVIDVFVDYDSSNDANKAFYVLQGMVVGERFAIRMGGLKDNNQSKLRVIYPFPAEDTSFCYGGASAEVMVETLKALVTLLIPGLGLGLELLDLLGIIDIHDINGVSGISADDFDQWDTLSHEYGHYVEGMMGFYGSSLMDIIKNNPTHSSRKDHFVDKDDKKFAMQLTWSESWATAFSFVAQDYYKSEYVSVNYAGDTKYDGSEIDDSIYSYEDFKISSNGNSGEAQEDAVIAFLWDLFDGGVESGDNIALGNTAWWAATTKKGTYTLTDLSANISADYHNYRSQVGEIMGMHMISASGLRATNSVTKTTPPQLTWEVGGSKSYPNTRFDIVFYDVNDNNQYDMTSVGASISGRQATYTIATSDWNNIVSKFGIGAKINIGLRAYNDSKGMTSGAYRSAYYTLAVV